MATTRFRDRPRPDEEVIALLEKILAAARNGDIRCIAVIVVNPVNNPEALFAGELTPIRSNALLGGITRAANDLLKRT